jgi:hypothetical protein
MPKMVLGDVASRCRLYLAAKPSHMGDEVDVLACSLHCPMVCSHQMWGHDFLSGAALSCCATVSGGAFPGVRSPRAWIFDGGLIIWIPVLSNLYTE